MTYIIHYKEKGQDWSKTSYTCVGSVTKQYLIDFFGLENEDVEEFKIETSNKQSL